MTEELFEIAFQGEIAEGADRETVMLRIGQMFKADAERVQKMFSGQRVTIKKQADAGMVAKYRAAFEKAGAVCIVRSLAEVEAERREAEAAASEQARPEPPAESVAESTAVTADADVGDLPPALQSRLRVRGDQIPDLDADLAPVGSPVQHRIVEPPPFEIDTDGLVLAPPGVNLVTSPEPPVPPLPDTSGLSLLDND
jgi:hypothetical protein